MIEKINLQDLKKDYPDFFQKAPDELIELAASEETASQIADICLKNSVEEEDKIEKIAYYVISVLLGQLPPETLPKAIIEDLKFNAATAEKIYLEINRLIFFSVKDILTEIYEEVPIKITMPKKNITPAPNKEKFKKSPRKDTYREVIE